MAGPVVMFAEEAFDMNFFVLDHINEQHCEGLGWSTGGQTKRSFQRKGSFIRIGITLQPAKASFQYHQNFVIHQLQGGKVNHMPLVFMISHPCPNLLLTPVTCKFTSYYCHWMQILFYHLNS